MARKKYSFGQEDLGEIKEKAEEETSTFNGPVRSGEAGGRGGCGRSQQSASLSRRRVGLQH